MSVDYQTLVRLKIDWTCYILNLSSIFLIPFFTIYDWHIHFRSPKLFCIILGHLDNSAIWIFTFSHLLTLFVSFWRFIRAVWFDFFLLSNVSHGYGCKFKMLWRYILRTQFSRLSNNKNSIKFVKLKKEGGKYLTSL